MKISRREFTIQALGAGAALGLGNGIRALAAPSGFGAQVLRIPDTVFVEFEDATERAARSGTSWVQQAKLVPNDGGSFDEFGTDVAISGNTIVVGASHKSFGQSLMQGAAYVFTRSGTRWNQQARVTASDGRRYDTFGYSVAIDGDRIVIGAITGQPAHQGAAYVFSRLADTWQQTAKLISAAHEFYSSPCKGEVRRGSVTTPP